MFGWILIMMIVLLTSYHPLDPITIQQTPVEVVSAQAATGDGGNLWGGHQSRIVRTATGVFTAYTTDTGDDLNRQWNLVWRRGEEDWQVLATGGAGREPVNLLAAPDGTLYIIGYPQGIGTLWSGQLQDGEFLLQSTPLPDALVSYWPYSAAGIDAEGNLCAVASEGGGIGGAFHIACYASATGIWQTAIYALDYRYAYVYVFPTQQGLSLVGTRDVEWNALGYTQPAATFDYVFNAAAWFHLTTLQQDSLEQVDFIDEPPTVDHPDVFLNAQMDAYLDTEGRMHILYWKQGASTNGIREIRHRILAVDGVLLADSSLTHEHLGYYNRLFQDAMGRFYLLSSSAMLFPLGEGADPVLGSPIPLDLNGFEVEYSGFGLSVPRTGTPLSNTLDVVFPSADETHWIYFRLTLPS